MFPISSATIDSLCQSIGIIDIGRATIRQIVSLAGALERHTGAPVVHLELGNPGIEAPAIGIEAECEALRNGVESQYPNIAGIPELKEAGSRFIKAFLNIDISPRCVVPTVGSMQGSYTAMMILGQRDQARRSILFINPGFPVQRHQARAMGLGIESFDIYSYRGAALEAKLEEYLSTGRIAGIIYSNPNNPAWINLTEQELEIIGRQATAHDTVVIEDMAYLGMDFRCDYSRPGVEPFIPTVARYTDNYIILLSASKIFSYAGQRIAIECVSDRLAERCFEPLRSLYKMNTFIDALIYGLLYCLSSGTAHSAQYAMAAMLNAAADGRLDFVDECREYERRSALARKAFTDNGFHLVYRRDGDREISNGFFFTVGYPGLSGEELQRQLLAYGIATIPLGPTGSDQPGVRVCVSALSSERDFDLLNERLSAFNHCMQHGQ